jgi:hypothetical protein
VKSKYASVLIYGSLVGSLATLAISFLALSVLEGSKNADGPGVGIGLLLVAAISLAAFAGLTCLGTISIAVAALRSKKWPKGVEQHAFYVGVAYSAMAAAVAIAFSVSL